MSEFFKALNRGRVVSENILKMCGYSDSSSSLQKGMLWDVFDREPEKRGFVVTKRGKLIKEKLNGLLSKEEQDLASCYAQIVSLSSKIGQEPTVPAENRFSYEVGGFKEALGTLPNVYDFKLMVEDSPTSACCDMGMDLSCSDNSEKESTKDLMYAYNDTVYRWITYKKDIAMINTMLSNFDDNKDYDLTVREATILGF